MASGFSHSLSLIGIAAVVHMTHHFVTGDHHHANDEVVVGMKWLSAGLVLLVGMWMLWSARNSRTHRCCGCAHHQEDSSGKIDDRVVPSNSSYSMSALLGAAFGLMPCPSALAAYFSGLAAGSPVQAYVVIGLFAGGIATSLTIVGMIVQVFGGRLISSSSRLARLPWGYIRGSLISLIGLVYLWHVATLV
ncbi:MAG: sulfite exporter TauE/SafE family protein [Planctomycetota bacterium]